MHHLSEQQRKALQKHRYVEKITTKQVIFTKEFKLKAVNLLDKGLSPNEVFVKAGLQLDWFKNNYPKNLLKKWKKKVSEHGKEALSKDGRGTGSTGRPKKENLDDLTYEELKVIVEIQRGVIEDLTKKKALAKKKG